MPQAVLMASGMGTRMRPLTDDTPKPLIPVCGTPMIETVLDGLISAGIHSVYIVVGYLGDSFEDYVSDYMRRNPEADIHLIKNPYYEHINNISSVYVARDILAQDDSFVCEADLYLTDKTIIQNHPDFSCYYGIFRPGYVNDWGFETDSDDIEHAFITRVCKGVTDCYNMTGIAYLLKNDAQKVAGAVKDAWGTPGYEDMFWDDVVDKNLDRLDLKVWPIGENTIAELDTPEELYSLESRLKTV